MAAVTAIDEAKRFLYLHPISTTAEDNPVQLLEAVIKEFDDALAVKTEELQADDDEDVEERAEALVSDTKTKLLAFIKGLRDDMKICEAEYQTAIALAEVTS